MVVHCLPKFWKVNLLKRESFWKKYSCVMQGCHLVALTNEMTSLTIYSCEDGDLKRGFIGLLAKIRSTSYCCLYPSVIPIIPYPRCLQIHNAL